MRQLAIQHRRNEMNLQSTRDNGGLQLDLRMTYGREMRDPDFSEMWRHPSNSYTLGVNGRIPIWDWGERKARVSAAEINVRQTDLRREEAELDIRASVQSEIRSIAEYQSRAVAMEENLTLAAGLSAQGLERYRAAEISLLELIQAFRRESDTAENLLDAYLGWRRSLSDLRQMTFYDFESDMPVLDRFGVQLRGAR
jgi:outer membrane protein TolC